VVGWDASLDPVKLVLCLGYLAVRAVFYDLKSTGENDEDRLARHKAQARMMMTGLQDITSERCTVPDKRLAFLGAT
jgi:hypothetical protein